MTFVEQLIDQEKARPLSDTDIRLDIGNKQFNVIPYWKIKDYKTIEELLGPNEMCFILYVWKSDPSPYGHWCLLSKHGNEIEFFDPYGSWPDSQLEKIEEPFRTQSGQKDKALTKLLLDFDGELSYNEFPFQKQEDGIATCGRHCVLRAYLKDMPLEDYKNLFLNKESGDDIVTFLTS